MLRPMRRGHTHHWQTTLGTNIFISNNVLVQVLQIQIYPSIMKQSGGIKHIISHLRLMHFIIVVMGNIQQTMLRVRRPSMAHFIPMQML